MGAAVSRELVGAAKVGCPMRAIGFGAYRGRGIGGDEPAARRQRGERLPMGRAGHWTLAMVRWVTARRKSWRSLPRGAPLPFFRRSALSTPVGKPRASYGQGVCVCVCVWSYGTHRSPAFLSSYVIYRTSCRGYTQISESLKLRSKSVNRHTWNKLGTHGRPTDCAYGTSTRDAPVHKFRR